jgi:hypothetical protein
MNCRKTWIYILVVVTISCKNASSNQQTIDIQPMPAALVEKHVQYVYTVNNELSSHFELKPENAETIVIEQSMHSSFEMRNRFDSAKQQMMDMVLQDFSMHIKTPQEEVDVDTSKIRESKLEFDKVFAPLIGAKFTATLDSNGKSIGITGTTDVEANMRKNAGGVKAVQGFVENFIKKAGIKNLVTAVTKDADQFLPKRKLNVGDTWEVNQTQKMSDFDLPLKMICTLKEISDSSLTIRYESNITETTQKLKLGGAQDVNAVLKGTVKGEIVLDRVFYKTLSQEMDTKIEGEINQLGNVIPIKITQQTKVLGRLQVLE